MIMYRFDINQNSPPTSTWPFCQMCLLPIHFTGPLPGPPRATVAEVLGPEPESANAADLFQTALAWGRLSCRNFSRERVFRSCESIRRPNALAINQRITLRVFKARKFEIHVELRPAQIRPADEADVLDLGDGGVPKPRIFFVVQKVFTSPDMEPDSPSRDVFDTNDGVS